MGLEIGFGSRLWLAMVLECINSWLFSHVKCRISLPASCILPTILRSYTSALQRAANEASTRLALHSVRCNWYNNADITRYWYVAGEHWQVRAHTKYPGAGCSIGAPQTSSSLNIHWLPVGHRITYKLCLTAWKTLHTSQPLYLSELISQYLPSRCLRSSNTNLLTRPAGITSNFSSRAFSVSAPSTNWNYVPAHIHSIDTVSTFKRHLI